MFRVQRFHKEKRKPPLRDITSIPVIFRSARPDDLIEFDDDFLFGYHVNKENILALFPDMQDKMVGDLKYQRLTIRIQTFMQQQIRVIWWY